MGRIEAICVSSEKGTVKRPVSEAEFRRDHGIVGDAHAGQWHRQVSLLPWESIEEFRANMPGLVGGPPAGKSPAGTSRTGEPLARGKLAGGKLTDGDFGENLVASGLDRSRLAVGARLRLGADVVLEVTQVGKECHHGCAISELTGDCIMPREGLFCRVLQGGLVRQGDRIDLTPGPRKA